MLPGIINDNFCLKKQISLCKKKKAGKRGVVPDLKRARKHPCKGLKRFIFG